MPAPLPPDESARLAALHECHILDTPPEPAFERIANLAAQILDAPIAAVSFIDRRRQWCKARVGIESAEHARKHAFCAYALSGGEELLVVPDARLDRRFRTNPYVTSEPGIRFYAGAPLRTAAGHVLGTLCVADVQPRDLDAKQRKILADLAAMVTDELTLRQEIAARERAEEEIRAQHASLQELTLDIERKVHERTAQLTAANQTLHDETIQRRLANRERRRSERRFQQLFSQASDAVLVHDEQGRLLDFNAAFCTSLGYSREELLNLSVPDIEVNSIPGEGPAFWQGLAVGGVEKFEGCHRRKDGSTFPVEVHLSVLETVEGRQLLGLIRDITERKRAEEQLRLRAREQEVVALLGARALSGVGLEELLDEAVRRVAETLGMEMCGVHEYLPGQDLIIPRAGLNLSPERKGQPETNAGQVAYARYVLRTGQPIVVANTAQETRFELPPERRGPEAVCGVCVLIGGSGEGGGRYGTLAVATRQLRALSDDDVFFVQAVANVLAAAIIRHRKDALLRETEIRYQRISARTPGAVYQYRIDAAGGVTIPFISEGCRALYGREAAEMQANPRLMYDAVYPDDLLGFADAALVAERETGPFHWQGRHLLPDGTVRWVRLDSQPERMPDGSIIWDGIVTDVTAQQVAALALHQTEERFRLSMLHLPFPVMLFCSDGEIVQVNHAFTHMTGYLDHELATMEDWLERAYVPEDRPKVRAFVADMTNHIGTVENPGRRVRCADGSLRIWDVTCANLDRLPDGRWLHICAAVDVTERHQGEAALRLAKEEAERANHAKSVFLSRMSHELRTPLNAILGFGQLLEFSPLDEQGTVSLDYILKGGRHLLSLIDEVLDLSRVETGDLRLVHSSVNVDDMARDCVGLVTRLAQARNITCRVKTSRNLRASLWVDEQRLRQMLLNLLANAIKYNREGGQVVVSSEKTPQGGIRLKVADTGIGISPEDISRLFVPFERLQQEYGEVEGTGLGLAVSRRLAEAMGGTLGVESEVGRGSTFWIELPASALRVATATEAVAPVPTPVSVARLPEEIKLLYIEDNQSNLEVVKALLTSRRPHWKFLPAREGRTGLELARQHLPDIILLDLQLPGINGDEVLSELRRDPSTHHIPTILLSADATAHSRERLLANGADAYVSKPFRLDELLELLDTTLLKAAAVAATIR